MCNDDGSVSLGINLFFGPETLNAIEAAQRSMRTRRHRRRGWAPAPPAVVRYVVGGMDITEVDVRDARPRFSELVWEVRLWNRRVVVVAGCEVASVECIRAPRSQACYYRSQVGSRGETPGCRCASGSSCG